MSAGNQPGRGKYGENVTKALKFILDQEKQFPAGFLHNPSATQHGPMYGHGFATLFLAESYGMVTNKELREKLKGTLGRAVKLIITGQNSEGGWRYQPNSHDADLSVTICQIMALRAARNAGFSVPKKTVDRCTEYVKACQDLLGGGGFRYQKHAGPPGFARTAAGVVALYSAGEYKSEAVDKGLKYLVDNCKPGNNGGFPRQNFHDFQLHYYYGHYYAAQAMWTAGGRYWQDWYPAIREELLNHQDRNQADGSWRDPRIQCSHYSTAMALIILQIPNNYLPILQK
jgi:hypothetical protein